MPCGCDTTSQPHGIAHGIGKGNSLKKFRDCDHLVTLLKPLTHHQLLLKRFQLQGNKSWLPYIMVSLGRHLILYDTSVFVRKWPETHLTFNPRLYHQHQLQPSFTAFAYTSKYNSGKEQGMAFCQKNGGGERVNMNYLSKLLLPAPDDLLRIIRCNCKSDCGTMRCTCKKNGIACSIVCGNCKWSGCMNSTTKEDDSDDDADIDE